MPSCRTNLLISRAAFKRCFLRVISIPRRRVEQVDLSEGGDTRAMAAAGIVDRMLLPENFVLMLDANRFGPVNAAITSVRRDDPGSPPPRLEPNQTR